MDEFDSTSTQVSETTLSPSVERPSWIRCWPLGLYFGCCLVLASIQQFIANFVRIFETVFSPHQLASGAQFGQAMGVGCVMALIAGLCGQNVIRSLGVASLLATAIFLTLMYQLFSEYSRFSELFYAYNLPLMIFGATIPLLIARTVTGAILSRRKYIVSTHRFRIDHLLQLTAVIACLIFFCRVPMQMHQLTTGQVAVYLPGLVLISALAATVTVLPSIKWVFQAKTTWRSWLLLVLMSSIGIAVLCLCFTLLLGRWMQGAVFRFDGTVITLVFFLPLYLAGIVALRASGFRWVQATQQTAEFSLECLREGRMRTGWLWTLGFLLVAISTAFPIHWVKRQERLTFENALQVLAEIRRDGGDAGISDRGVHQIKLPPENTEYWMGRLMEFPLLNSVNLTSLNISDADVERLVRENPMISRINLSDTPITDVALKYLAKAEYLNAVNLSRTNVSASAIAELLSSSTSRIRGLTLEDLQFTDEDFERLYSSRIDVWGLAGNRLSDKSLLTLFGDGGYSLDFSRNPGIESIFLNPQIRSSPYSVTLDDVNIGDAEIAAWLAVTTPSRVVLGRTSITITGLSSLLNSCESIAFLEGSFDEEALRQLRPLTIPNSIGISGKSLTGDFLAQWGGLPNWLDASSSSFSDVQLEKLAERQTQRITAIRLVNCSITDVSIPFLEKMQVQHLDLSGTQVTANAILQSSLSNVTITVSPGQFTYEEVEQLRQKNRVNVVSGIESQW